MGKRDYVTIARLVKRFPTLSPETLKYWGRTHCGALGRLLRTLKAEEGYRLYHVGDTACAVAARGEAGKAGASVPRKPE
jgi:hypothetical protein